MSCWTMGPKPAPDPWFSRWVSPTGEWRSQSVEGFFGRGVFYGSGATEGPAVAGTDVFVVGGGNSAAEAVVHLAKYARKVTLLVRGSSIDDVSDYLVRQLEDRPNIEILLNTEIAEARGGGRLGSLVLRNRADGTEQERAAFAVFILIGGTPRTEWLPDQIARDQRRVRAHRRRSRPREPRPDPRNECAGDLCRRRRPSRLGQTCGRRSRRGRNHHSPDPRVPS